MIVEERQRSLLKKSQTVQLWIQYIAYVEVCRNIIRAARASDWTLHLYPACKMIKLFTATGHHIYAKSACVYVKLMFALPEKHPWLHQKFVAGRGDSFWTGL